MFRMNMLLSAWFISAISQVCQADPVTELSGNIGQLAQPLEYQRIPNARDYYYESAYYHIQRTRDGDDRLFLTPNEGFFHAVDRLVAAGEGPEQVKEDGVGLPGYKGRGINQRSRSNRFFFLLLVE